MNVVILDPTPSETLEFIQGFAEGVTLRAPQSGSREELMTLLPGAEGLLSKNTRIDESLMQAAGSSLKLLQLWSGRRDNVDLSAAQAHKLTVALMPQVGCIAVAELTLLLMLGVSKKIVQADRLTRQGAYRDLGLTPELTAERKHAFQWLKLPNLFELYGKTLGLVGFGEIATEVARRANVFGMKVLYTKRQRLPEDIEQEENVSYRDFGQLLTESDFVSLHVPHTAYTEKMIDAAALAQMKSDAFLINTCRGGVVDEAALVLALQTGSIAGAGLDVFVYEPVPYDNPLLGLENVVLVPHIGGGSGGARVKQARDAVSNFNRWLAGEPLQHVILEAS